MFDLGIQELIVIFLVALIVFGPKKLPELGRTLGKAMSDLKKAMHGIKEQMDAELHDVKPSVSLPSDILKDVNKNEEKKVQEVPDTSNSYETEYANEEKKSHKE